MKRHVILVGLPGCGKSTVGQLVADALDTAVLDIDEVIERAEGCTVSEIFESQGEQAFRALETRETERALSGDPAVIVPGGGWAAQPGNLESVGDRGMTVYLKTGSETASSRVTAETRPLLQRGHPEVQMRLLLVEREASYGRCETRVTTDGKTTRQVARMVVELARCWGGW